MPNEIKSIFRNINIPFVVLSLLFFMWGFIISMNNVLIPHLQGAFNLNFFQSMLVQFAFFSAFFIGSLIYFLISARYGDLISKMGYKNGLILGLIISGLGCFLFYPASEFNLYFFFLSALFLLGFGITLLQIAANPYAVILGPESSASSRLNLAQGVNSLGTVLAPLAGGYILFQYYKNIGITGAESVKLPYLFLGFLFMIMALISKLTPFPNFSQKSPARGFEVLRKKGLVKGIFAIFLAIGAEVAIASILINFLNLENIAGLNNAEASVFLSYYWGGLMIGRFMGAVMFSGIKRKLLVNLIIVTISFLVIFSFSGIEIAQIYLFFLMVTYMLFIIGKGMPGKTVAIFSSVIVILVTIQLFTSGQIAMWSIISIGLFGSIMWSNIFTLAIKGLGKYTTQGSSLLIMAILGAAIIPPVQGALADSIGIKYSFVIIILCHLFIISYGLTFKKIN